MRVCKKKEARFVINKIFCYLCICVIAYLALRMLLCGGAFMEFFGAFLHRFEVQTSLLRLLILWGVLTSGNKTINS